MEVIRPLLLLLLGLTTLALAAVREFHFVSQSKNWTDAQSYCREKFTDLATIQSQDDWSRVSQMIAKSGHSYAWLGLYDDVKSWRWSLDDSPLYHTDLVSWFDFDQDNSDGVENCARFINGRLDDYTCQSTERSVCYHESTNSYILVTQLLSWQSAQTYCREHYTELASIRDQQELNVLIGATHPNVYYWVGLSRGGWKWSDQSDSSFRRWGSEEPRGGGEDCGVATVDGWYGYTCDDSYPFICTGPSRKVLRVTVKTGGSLDLNHPLVQEAIVKQIEKDLRAQGLTQELRLSWRKQPHGYVFNKTEL